MVLIDNPKYHARLQVDIKTNSTKTMKAIELVMEKINKELATLDLSEVEVYPVVYDLSPKQE